MQFTFVPSTVPAVEELTSAEELNRYLPHLLYLLRALDSIGPAKFYNKHQQGRDGNQIPPELNQRYGIHQSAESLHVTDLGVLQLMHYKSAGIDQVEFEITESDFPNKPWIVYVERRTLADGYLQIEIALGQKIPGLVMDTLSPMTRTSLQNGPGYEQHTRVRLHVDEINGITACYNSDPRADRYSAAYTVGTPRFEATPSELTPKAIEGTIKAFNLLSAIELHPEGQTQ